MRIIDRSVLIFLLLSFLYSDKIISQECPKDTVYIVFESSKFAEERNYFYLLTKDFIPGILTTRIQKI